MDEDDSLWGLLKKLGKANIFPTVKSNFMSNLKCSYSMFQDIKPLPPDKYS